MKQKALSIAKRGFTLIELLVVISIIGILANIGLNTFTSAQKKSRDTKRKAHLKQLKDSLESYYNDKEEYPNHDSDGNILGCGVDAEELCVWGETPFSNTTTNNVYMIQMPADPSLGFHYYYQSITVYGKRAKFQLYARLENTKDIDIPKDGDNPQNYGISCGTFNCNYGISSTNTSPSEGRTLETE
jgi:general secretion pathway protein G